MISKMSLIWPHLRLYLISHQISDETLYRHRGSSPDLRISFLLMLYDWFLLEVTAVITVFSHQCHYSLFLLS